MKNISAKEVKERLDSGEELHLLDVRNPDERAEFNIGGQLLPLPKIQTMEIEEIEDWKNEELICYCRSGHRSELAGLFLEHLGFTDVKNMVGGVEAYKQLIHSNFAH